MPPSSIFVGLFLLVNLLLDAQCHISALEAQNPSALANGIKKQESQPLNQNQPSGKILPKILENVPVAGDSVAGTQFRHGYFMPDSENQVRNEGVTVSQNLDRRTVYTKVKRLESRVGQANIVKVAVGNQNSNVSNVDQSRVNESKTATVKQVSPVQGKDSSNSTSAKNPSGTQDGPRPAVSDNMTKNNNNADVGKNASVQMKPLQSETQIKNQSKADANVTGNSLNNGTQNSINTSQKYQIEIKNDTKIKAPINDTALKPNLTSVPPPVKNETKAFVNTTSPTVPPPVKNETKPPSSTTTIQSISQTSVIRSITNTSNSSSKSTFTELANSLFEDSLKNSFFNASDKTKSLLDSFFNDTNTGSIFNSNNFFSNPFSTGFDPNKKQIVNKEFKGIGFYHDIPLSFMTGQVFKFHGVVLNPTLIMSSGPFKYNFVNIVFSERGSDSEFRCVEEISVKDLQFHISCKMQKSGRYYLSIFPGETGQSSYKMRSVRDTSVFMSSALAFNLKKDFSPANLSCDIVDNKLQIRWGTIAPLTNLTISQNLKKGGIVKKQFLLSNYHQKFYLPFAEFSQFEQTTTFVEISHADSDDGTLYEIASTFSKMNAKFSFQAIRHQFDQQKEDLATITPPIPWRIKPGGKIKFNATFKEDIRNQVFIILPDGVIGKGNFSKNLPAKATVKAGTPLDLELTLWNPGTHILQINAASGMAIINRPIYVGDGLPLIPDHKDLLQPSVFQQQITNPKKALQDYVTKNQNLTQSKQEPNPNSTLTQKRNYLLFLLNNLRKNYKVDPVVLDDQLNLIAQFHSDDMNKNNFFSHTSLNGDGPGQRAKKYNFTNSIGENIAQANSLTEAHLNLERSADHLQNSVKGEWRRVGIGIARSNLSQYYVTFEFSGRNLAKEPLSKQEMQKIRKDIVKLILDKNTNIKKENSKLSADVGDWMDTSREPGLFQYLFSKNYSGAMSASSFTISYSLDLTDRLVATGYLSGFYRFQEVGLGLRMQKNSIDMLQLFAVFA